MIFGGPNAGGVGVGDGGRIACAFGTAKSEKAATTEISRIATEVIEIGFSFHILIFIFYLLFFLIYVL